MVELIFCQLGELVLVVVSEKRIRLLVGDQLLELLELLELLGNLLVPCVNFVLPNGGVNSLTA